jgi:hypothetical protein
MLQIANVCDIVSPIYDSYWCFPISNERHAAFCSGQMYVWPSHLKTLKVHTNNKVTITALNGENNTTYLMSVTSSPQYISLIDIFLFQMRGMQHFVQDKLGPSEIQAASENRHHWINTDHKKLLTMLTSISIEYQCVVVRPKMN